MPAPAARNISAEKQRTAMPPTALDRIPPSTVASAVNPQIAPMAQMAASDAQNASRPFAFRNLSCLFSGSVTIESAQSPSRPVLAMNEPPKGLCHPRSTSASRGAHQLRPTRFKVGQPSGRQLDALVRRDLAARTVPMFAIALASQKRSNQYHDQADRCQQQARLPRAGAGVSAPAVARCEDDNKGHDVRDMNCQRDVVEQ
jgi:hypothetical protein